MSFVLSYQELINSYAFEFSRKHDLDLFELNVELDVALFIKRTNGDEVFIDHSDIRLDIDNDVPIEVFIDYLENGIDIEYRDWVLDGVRCRVPLNDDKDFVTAFIESRDFTIAQKQELYSFAAMLYNFGLEDGSQILEN